MKRAIVELTETIDILQRSLLESLSNYPSIWRSFKVSFLQTLSSIILYDFSSLFFDFRKGSVVSCFVLFGVLSIERMAEGVGVYLLNKIVRMRHWLFV